MVKKIGTAAAAVVVLGLLVLLGHGRLDLDQNRLLGTGCAIPARITAVPGAAPDGGAVRVAEQGTGAAVLENTSTFAAYRIVVASGSRTFEVPVLTPGQRIGVVLDRPVAGPAIWLPPEALGGFTPVTATVVPGGIRYHSGNCRALTSRGAAVLFRDTSGRITGGEQLPAASVSCTPGDRVLPGGAPHAEIYPYCALGAE